MTAICFRRVGFQQDGAVILAVSNVVVVSMVGLSWSDDLFDSCNCVHHFLRDVFSAVALWSDDALHLFGLVACGGGIENAVAYWEEKMIAAAAAMSERWWCIVPCFVCCNKREAWLMGSCSWLVCVKCECEMWLWRFGLGGVGRAARCVAVQPAQVERWPLT